ncbi:EAL domain-containing protein [Methylomonas rapida]|uniref:EAL domain-containing protein n=1 Tax=Methylomonas rapida TaxID=2963939 RepID=A0ABY7GPD5_9GAMM|nr:EAL domain-containing protein [Methylomonas rapida]WAR46372.1 EAL domain-containing protein [Methylomonas rapida]
MRPGIGLKLGFWLALLGTVSTGLTGYYVYDRSHTLLIEESQEKLLTATRGLAHRFNVTLAAIASDVDFLSQLSLSRSLAEQAASAQALSDEQRLKLADIFAALLRAHPEYSQIRLIDAQHYGKELVRVDRDHNEINLTPDDQLQEKSHFPYVFETLRLPIGQFYISNINLNQELSAHQGFGKPTIRIAASLPSPDNKPAAIIVIDTNLDELFGQISKELPHNVHLLLTNHRGDYLLHPDPAKTFGFERGRSFLIQDDIAATREMLEGDTDWLVFAGHDGDLFGNAFLAAFVKQGFGPVSEPRFILLGLYTAMENVLMESQALGRQVVQLTLLFSLLATLISLSLARILAKPLKAIAHSVSQFELGQPLLGVPSERNDEIGYLAHSFQAMAQQLNAQVAELHASEAKLHAILDNAPVGIWLVGTDGHYLFVNHTFCNALGMEESRFQAGDALEDLLGREYAQRFLQADQACLEHPQELHRCQETLILADGEAHTMEISRTPLQGIDGEIIGIIGMAMDVSERQQATERVRAYNHVLELLAKDADLSDILDAIVLGVEAQNPAQLCSILLVDSEGQHLLTGSAPHLPAFYNDAVNGLKIGPGAGSCGTAAHTGQRVIVENIQQHPYWVAFKDLAARAGLAACWSEPVRSASGALLGTFAIYRREPASPCLKELQRIEQAANLAGIAIDRYRANTELQLASLVYQNSSEAMAVTDAQGTIITINPAFTELTGYTLNEVVGKNHNILKSNHQDQSFYQNMWAAINSAGYWKGELWNRRKNGELFAELLTINTIFNPDGTPYRRVALFSDITQKKQSEELIWTHANFDPLTNLPNRRMFHDRLRQEVKKAHRCGLPMALIFLDLDRFKEVNDTLGHDMGDLLLQDAAQRLTKCVRETDTVARLGGDEFTLILNELTDIGDVERIVQNLLLKLAEPFQLKDKLAYVSASIGITFYPRDGNDIETLIKNADQAMYAAKHQGRNRYSYFTPSMQEEALRRMQTAEDLRQALSDGQFELHYQPIVDLTTGNIPKAEALLRWRHPGHELRGPEEFISIAEDIGIINQIGDWVFRQASQQLANWRRQYHPTFKIGINISPVQFHDSGSLEQSWLKHLRQLGLSADGLVVEITEGLLLDASEQVNETLRSFRNASMQIALDDFGTGYSSLAYLKKFDIDYIKIDRSFVSHLASDSNDIALCEAIIVMAHKLGMKVIAEGIETPVQRDLLANAGCDYGQGYLFSRPLPAEAFEALFERGPFIDAALE